MTPEERAAKLRRLQILKMLPELGVFPHTAMLWFEQPYESEADLFSAVNFTAKQYPFLAGKTFTLNQIDTFKARSVVLRFPSSLMFNNDLDNSTKLIR